MSGKSYNHGGYSVSVAEDGAILVKPGDALSKYSMAIHHDFDLKKIEQRFGRMNGGGQVASFANTPGANINVISAGETLYHMETHEKWKQGQNTPTPVLSPAKTQALKLVEAFANRSSVGAFTQIARQDVAEGLRIRVRTPREINQGLAGVCPSASIVFIEARDRPVEYVKLVTSLYENGYGFLRTWKIIPKWDLKNYKPPVDEIHVADWIPMASIRDSENWFFDYEQIYKGWFPIFWSGGASSYEIARWLRQAGYTKVINKTSHFMTSGKDNLVEAGRLWSQGYKVILRIDADVLNLPEDQWENDNPTIIPGGNHVVVLTSAVNISPSPLGELVDFTVYTWGRSRRSIVPNDASQFRLNVYLGYHYGFLAAKY